MKPLLTSLKVALASFLGQLIFKLIYLTCKKPDFLSVRDTGYNKVRESPVIITFWHGHQILMLGVQKDLFKPHPKRKTFALISEHTDGRIISGIIKHFDLDSIAGSSSRGAKKASIKMIRTLESGDNIAITPDGPRGPYHEVKAGVVKIAQMSGKAVLPMAVHASSHWQLKSWDKMIVPKPFSKISYYIGEPIYVPRELGENEVEGYCGKIKDALNACENKVRSFYA